MGNITKKVQAYIYINDVMPRYNEVYAYYKNQQISEQLWNSFCLACLKVLMEDNQDILKRLKNI